MLGHILSLALLAVGLWRGRAVPASAALLLGLSQILHFTFAVIALIHVLEAAPGA